MRWVTSALLVCKSVKFPSLIALMVEAAGTSGPSVNFNISTRRYIAEDIHILSAFGCSINGM
jgi:hypothetical protein